MAQKLKKVLEAYYKQDAIDFKDHIKEEWGKKRVSIRKGTRKEGSQTRQVYRVYTTR